MITRSAIPPPSTLPLTPTSTANSIIKVDQTASELAQYFSASCFSPSPSILLWTIIRNHLVSWTGITTRLITKYLSKKCGHCKREPWSRGKEPTVTQLVKNMEIDTDLQPLQEPSNIKSNNIMCAIINSNGLSKHYSDQTDCFPVHSLRGNEYISICLTILTLMLSILSQ